MKTNLSQSNLANLYEQDIALWSDQMVDLLRQGKFDQLDIEHLNEGESGCHWG
jgi:hypothetical protein